MLEGNSLVPTIEDIYFLTGLSKRGEPVNFQKFPSGPHNISKLKEFLVSVLEWWYEDIRTLFLWFVDGKCYCHDRVVEGPMSPLMMTYFLGCCDISQS
jgi:hypothetical protein